MHRKRLGSEGATKPPLLLLFLAGATLVHCGQSVCGPPVRIATQSTHFWGSLGLDTERILQNTSLPAAVVAVLPIDACASKLGPETLAGAVAVAARGNCTFLDKALAAQRSGAAALLIYNTEPGCIYMGFNRTDEPVAHSLSIPVLSITQATGEALLDMAAAPSGDEGEGGLKVTLEPVELWPMDPSAGVLFLMAIATLIGGALLSGRDHQRERSRARGERRATEQVHEPGPGEVIEISPWQAVGMIGMSACVLLLLFYFMSRWFFYVLLAIFSFAGAQSLGIAFEELIMAFGPSSYAKGNVNLPVVGPTPTPVVLSYPVSITLSLMWLFNRNATWAWPIQDAMGIALMLSVLRMLRIGSIKVACILLPLAFLYDVFFVFISPLFFGESVMVEVATGGPVQEPIPMLLKVPRMQFPELGGYTMLGYGDIILPGLLVAYLRRADLDLGLPLIKGYFLPSAAGYTAGLLLTFAAVTFSWFGDQGQPALLYLVPCVLGATLALATARGDLRTLWTGKSGKHKTVGGSGGENDHDSDAPISRSNSETHLLAGESAPGAVGSVTGAGTDAAGGHMGAVDTGSSGGGGGGRDRDIEVGGLQQQQQQRQQQQHMSGGIATSRSAGGLSVRKA